MNAPATVSLAPAEPEAFASPLWHRSFAQTVDRLTSECFGLGPLLLMEVAGRAVAQEALVLGARDRGVVVLAGSGNNGGDAFVAARHLHEAGCHVHAMLVGSPAKLTPTCHSRLESARAVGVNVSPYREGALSTLQLAHPVVIDGVLGLGFHGTLTPGLLRSALQEAADLTTSSVVAIDLPSGLDADQSEVADVPLKADVTVTFGGLKPAHTLAPARDLCGSVVACDIGFPARAQSEAAAQTPPVYWLARPAALLAMNPWGTLGPSAHKYDRGHVLVIGGSYGKSGAPVMAALAALRAGAGWSTLALPSSARASLYGQVPLELTFEDLFQGETLDPQALQCFLKDRRVAAVAIGPGCMSQPCTPEVIAVLDAFTKGALGTKPGFVVLDAGATSQIAPLLEGGERPASNWLLTPHPGEWHKLGTTLIPPTAVNTIPAVSTQAAKWGVTLAYKSATPVVVAPTGPAFVTNTGSLALARAGSGDVLSGVAAAHGAMGLAANVAFLRAQTVVARAATAAACVFGPHAVLPTDIIARLGCASAID